MILAFVLWLVDANNRARPDWTGSSFLYPCAYLYSLMCLCMVMYRLLTDNLGSFWLLMLLLVHSCWPAFCVVRLSVFFFLLVLLRILFLRTLG